VTQTVDSTLAQAYQVCEAITRDQARNFFYGIRLLPAQKRDALCALYALSRRIDDIGDGDMSLPDKKTALATLRNDLAAIATSADPVLVAVADSARRYPLPLGAFDELVDGVEMDLDGRSYQTFDELVVYCRCVAGAVGRLCLGVFGAKADPRASEYADKMGIALQQTNILRDIREDLSNGRVYLPARELEQHGVELILDEHGNLADKDGNLAAYIVFAAGRNRAWYDEGRKLLPLLDWRSSACTAAMAGIYRRLLENIAEAPSSVFDRRLSLSGWQKAGVAARALAGGAL
jgi:15-cis-phytoene synthase